MSEDLEICGGCKLTTRQTYECSSCAAHVCTNCYVGPMCVGCEEQGDADPPESDNES